MRHKSLLNQVLDIICDKSEVWSDIMPENLIYFKKTPVYRSCIFILNCFSSKNNCCVCLLCHRGVQFTQGGDCLEFTNAFEIPARDAVSMEVMSMLILLHL